MTGNTKSTDKQYPKPDLSDVLNEAKRSTMIDLNCVQIGIIEAFDPGTQSATIKLALKRIVAIDPNGVKTLQERPLILKCPCFFPFGGGAYLTMPIQAGDTCIVLFNDREIDNWWVNGGVQTPTSRRTHDISDAFALVGIRNVRNALDDYIANGARLAFSANSRITLTDDLIASIADIFLHTGNMHITGNLTIGGNTYGDGAGGSGGDINLYANIQQQPGFEIHDGRRISGSFERVTVIDGIVVGGS